jgi:large subunit ribosomal protein L15
MKFHELNVTSHNSSKRAGRGIASGRGKTAGRGTKGQHARTGSAKKPGFEGGQNPLMQRLPKLRGFRSPNLPAEIVTTKDLGTIKPKIVDAFTLTEAGLVSSPYVNIKVIVKGELAPAKTVKLPGASKGAIAAIEKAGGSFEPTPRVRHVKKESSSKPRTQPATSKRQASK